MLLLLDVYILSHVVGTFSSMLSIFLSFLPLVNNTNPTKTQYNSTTITLLLSSSLFSFTSNTFSHAATNLRYGHINWNITASSTGVEFHVQLAFALVQGGPVPTPGALLYPGALDFGDGYCTQSILLAIICITMM